MYDGPPDNKKYLFINIITLNYFIFLKHHFTFLFLKLCSYLHYLLFKLI